MLNSNFIVILYFFELCLIQSGCAIHHFRYNVYQNIWTLLRKASRRRDLKQPCIWQVKLIFEGASTEMFVDHRLFFGMKIVRFCMLRGHQRPKGVCHRKSLLANKCLALIWQRIEVQLFVHSVKQHLRDDVFYIFQAVLQLRRGCSDINIFAMQYAMASGVHTTGHSFFLRGETNAKQ